MDWQRMLSWMRRLVAGFRREGNQGKVLLGAFLLALGLWAVVTLNEIYESEINVPIAIIDDPQATILEVSSAEVGIRIRGSGVQLLLTHLAPFRDTLRFPLEKNGQGAVEIPMDQHLDRLARLVPQVDVLGTYPQNITVRYDIKAQKKVPLRLGTQILLKPSLQLVSPPIYQDSVVLLGREGLLKTIEEWQTMPGVTKMVDKREVISIRVDTALGIEPHPSTVEVEVHPIPFSQLTLIRHLRVTGVPQGQKVHLSHQEIRISCALPTSSLANQAPASRDTIYIPYQELDLRYGVWTPDFNLLDPNVNLLRMDPPRVGFWIISQKQRLSGL